MKRFLQRLLLFAAPWTMVVLAYLVLDPFRVLRYHEDMSRDCVVDLNKDHAGVRTYLRHWRDRGYDSFLFGSSRTLAFRLNDWRTHLPAGSEPYAFDAHKESLYGMVRKLELIDSLGAPLRNALIVVDPLNTFAPYRNSEGSLFVKDPVLTGESTWSFQKTFLEAWFADLFFVKYLDHRITGARRPYMRDALMFNGDNRYDPITMERLMPMEDSIAANPDRYYRMHAGFFPPRDTTRQRHHPAMMGPEHRAGAERMAKIFRDRGTRFEVIIAPLYDQMAIAPEDLAHLEQTFGREHVHDLSGINAITRDVRNYIESSHFRPHVGRRIMDQVYGPASR